MKSCLTVLPWTTDKDDSLKATGKYDIYTEREGGEGDGRPLVKPEDSEKTWCRLGGKWLSAYNSLPEESIFKNESKLKLSRPHTSRKNLPPASRRKITPNGNLDQSKGQQSSRNGNYMGNQKEWLSKWINLYKRWLNVYPNNTYILWDVCKYIIIVCKYITIIRQRTERKKQKRFV